MSVLLEPPLPRGARPHTVRARISNPVSGGQCHLNHLTILREADKYKIQLLSLAGCCHLRLFLHMTHMQNRRNPASQCHNINFAIDAGPDY